MLIHEVHPEDIKAAIRKRYRSLLAFERIEGLPRQAVTELLRGRKSARTEAAVRRVLDEQRLGAGARGESIIADASSGDAATHRLNAGAR